MIVNEPRNGRAPAEIDHTHAGAAILVHLTANCCELPVLDCHRRHNRVAAVERVNPPVHELHIARAGVPMDKVEGFKWHIVAKTAGRGDPMLDEALAALSPEDRAKAQQAARIWLGNK